MPDHAAPEQPAAESPAVPLTTIAREWGRIGFIGFGGPDVGEGIEAMAEQREAQWPELRRLPR